MVALLWTQVIMSCDSRQDVETLGRVGDVPGKKGVREEGREGWTPLVFLLQQL